MEDTRPSLNVTQRRRLDGICDIWAASGAGPKIIENAYVVHICTFYRHLSGALGKVLGDGW
jgi:hypothetical protein